MVVHARDDRRGVAMEWNCFDRARYINSSSMARQSPLAANADDFAICRFGLLFGDHGFRYAKVSFGISPTVVEISEHPLYAGQDCLVAVSQSGIMQIRRLVVLLVCEESATFQQGTDSRTETHRVVEEVCHTEDDLTIDDQQPFATQFLITIPETAMHSFQSANHEICWKLIVRMRLLIVRY